MSNFDFDIGMGGGPKREQTQNPLATAGLSRQAVREFDDPVATALTLLKMLRRIHHPDVGGSAEKSARVNTAAEDLEDSPLVLKKIVEDYLNQGKLDPQIDDTLSQAADYKRRAAQESRSLVDFLVKFTDPKPTTLLNHPPLEITLRNPLKLLAAVQEHEDRARDRELMDSTEELLADETKIDFLTFEDVPKSLVEKVKEDVMDSKGSVVVLVSIVNDLLTERKPEIAKKLKSGEIDHIPEKLESQLTEIALKTERWQKYFTDQVAKIAVETRRNELLHELPDTHERLMRKSEAFNPNEDTERQLEAAWRLAMRESFKLRSDGSGTLNLNQNGEETVLSDVALVGCIFCGNFTLSEGFNFWEETVQTKPLQNIPGIGHAFEAERLLRPLNSKTTLKEFIPDLPEIKYGKDDCLLLIGLYQPPGKDPVHVVMGQVLNCKVLDK